MSSKKPTAPMFSAEPGKDSNGSYVSNSHPAADNMTNSRLMDPATPISTQVCQQVFGGSGARMSFSAANVDPRNPAGWPLTDDRFASLLTKGTR